MNREKYCNILNRQVKMIVKPCITIGIALAIGAVLIINAGQNPIYAYGVLLKGAFGSANGILSTLGKATPLIFTGLAASIAAMAGVFNIGIEGQMYFGALAAGLTGYYLGWLPAGALIPACFLAAMVAALIWGVIPGVLNQKLGIDIFVLFFMMNNMALLITEYLAGGPFKGELSDSATFKVAENARLYRFTPYADLDIGLILAVILAIAVWIFIKKTRFGYECMAIGLNRDFSRYIGIHVDRLGMLMLVVSAMLAGMAGAQQSLGPIGRFYSNFSDSLGFTGISIGLLAANNPVGVLIFAVFFGALTSGGLQMSVQTGIPGNLIQVIQSLMIILISGDFAIQILRKRRAGGEKNGVHA